MTLLEMSLCGAVMTGAVLVIQALGRRVLPQRTFPILWGLVTLRLLAPFTLPLPFSLPGSTPSVPRLTAEFRPYSLPWSMRRKALFRRPFPRRSSSLARPSGSGSGLWGPSSGRGIFAWCFSGASGSSGRPFPWRTCTPGTACPKFPWDFAG